MTDKQWIKREFAVPDFPLSAGGSLRQARLIYHQMGSLNAPKDNLILLPTYYGGAAAGNHPWVGPGSPLDPDRYCIVIPAMLGAGESSSPSNTPAPQAGSNFPTLRLADNIQLQKRLVDEVFDGATLALVAGWSMGGMQALQWASLYPERVRAVVASCCTARCSPHNGLFLEGLKSALQADPRLNDGCAAQPVDGLKAFARVYAGWAYSQAFFRNGDYRALGFDDIDALLAFWEQDHLDQDAHDLLAVLNVWQHADISAAADAFEDALARITMPTRILPCRSDLYFTEDDARREAALMPGAHVQVLDSDWGHIAGGPGRNPAVMRIVFDAVRAVLSS
ncbi:alpha/beta fold hydrolase [Marinobacter sp. JSM 1782161]|uniref:alpha/beta fold hydrolase n=1 Tax=Marinobacter sp. JSM 1782161 TaxID=2685906 RepID=UPI001402FAAA|nr:alpha/beta fold hydrolase [Marinobacter sp. JSM 1782161]